MSHFDYLLDDEGREFFQKVAESRAVSSLPRAPAKAALELVKQAAAEPISGFEKVATRLETDIEIIKMAGSCGEDFGMTKRASAYMDRIELEHDLTNAENVLLFNKVAFAALEGDIEEARGSLHLEFPKEAEEVDVLLGGIVANSIEDLDKIAAESASYDDGTPMRWDELVELAEKTAAGALPAGVKILKQVLKPGMKAVGKGATRRTGNAAAAVGVTARGGRSGARTSNATRRAAGRFDRGSKRVSKWLSRKAKAGKGALDRGFTAVGRKIKGVAAPNAKMRRAGKYMERGGPAVSIRKWRGARQGRLLEQAQARKARGTAGHADASKRHAEALKSGKAGSAAGPAKEMKYHSKEIKKGKAAEGKRSRNVAKLESVGGKGKGQKAARRRAKQSTEEGKGKAGAAQREAEASSKKRGSDAPKGKDAGKGPLSKAEEAQMRADGYSSARIQAERNSRSASWKAKQEAASPAGVKRGKGEQFEEGGGLNAKEMVGMRNAGKTDAQIEAARQAAKAKHRGTTPATAGAVADKANRRSGAQKRKAKKASTPGTHHKGENAPRESRSPGRRKARGKKAREDRELRQRRDAKGKKSSGGAGGDKKDTWWNRLSDENKKNLGIGAGAGFVGSQIID